MSEDRVYLLCIDNKGASLTKGKLYLCKNHNNVNAESIFCVESDLGGNGFYMKERFIHIKNKTLDILIGCYDETNCN